MATDSIKKTVSIENRKARFNYELLDDYTAGIALMGTEIKSIRQGKVNMSDSHCAFEGNELMLLNMHINPYENASFFKHEEKRPRKLLLKKVELKRIRKGLEEKGYTLIPTRLFINEKGLCKISISLARGKKTFDKREDIKERDQEREMRRAEK